MGLACLACCSHVTARYNHVREYHNHVTASHRILKNKEKQFNYLLTIEYNKARQAAITTEIIEIVSGANALEG